MFKLLVGIFILNSVYIVNVETKPFIFSYAPRSGVSRYNFNNINNNNNNYDPLADLIKRILTKRVTRGQTLLTYVLKQALDPDNVPTRKPRPTQHRTTTPLVTVFTPDEEFNKDEEEKDKISKKITSAADDKDNEILFNVKDNKDDNDDTSKGDAGGGDGGGDGADAAAADDDDEEEEVVKARRQPSDYIDDLSA